MGYLQNTMKKNKLNKLSRRERQIMDIVYEQSEVSAQDIWKQLPDPPGYSAVRAMLARLVNKQVLEYRQDGPRYLYYPVIDTEDAKNDALSGLLKTFFNNSPAEAVTALLGMEQDKMSPDELNEISRLIERAKEEGR